VATGTTSAQRGGIGGGVFLVGLGMLLLTGWWWPGILVVIGAAIAADRMLEGHFTSAVVVLAIFVGIPVGIAILSSIDIPWTLLIAFVLIVLGGAAVVRAVLARAG
jgi:hypothetical protein